MVGRPGFEPGTFCTSSTTSLLKDFFEFQIVDLQRAKTTANDKVYYTRKFLDEIKLNPVDVIHFSCIVRPIFIASQKKFLEQINLQS